MPNTCTICRHENRAEIEDKMVRGVSLRSIGKAYGTTHATLNRHRECIANDLQELKNSRAIQFSESLIQRLDRYRLVAEKHLDDEEKALLALDRCYKQLDIEAKLTGAYQKKQENQPDKNKRDEIIVEAYKQVFSGKTYEEAISLIRAIYEAKDGDEFEKAIRIAIEADSVAVESVWDEAEIRVSQREKVH
jgi:hypothetical protein